jgi:hypothetical protein
MLEVPERSPQQVVAREMARSGWLKRWSGYFGDISYE